ncbi:MAG: hypothetical protein J6M17_04210 [Ruminococcus sp.]|nr:hypothetical protein [Ruminococcus sp.]
MGKGLETGSGKENLVPDEDYEFEKKAAEEARLEREQAEEKKREAEQQRLKKKREAQKARERQLAQDRIDLMKMKAGIAEEDEIIKEEHSEVRELHGWEKIKNIWYHDKLWILLGTFCVAIVGFMVFDAVTKVNPDLSILFVCDNAAQNDESLGILSDMIAEYTPDLNGDGQVKVNIINCALNPSKYDTIYATNSQKFYANMQLAENIVVIADSNLSSDISDIMSKDLPSQIPDNPYVDERGVSLNFKFLADEMKCPNMPNDMYICMRVPIKTLSDDKETMQKNYDDALIVVKAFAQALKERAEAENDPGLTTEPEIIEVPDEENEPAF